MDIAKIYDEVSQCNRCGFCQVACPVFRATNRESGVARGRLALFGALLESKLDWDKKIEEPLYNCLLCGSCTANCFSSIPTADLVVKGRAQYLEKLGRKPVHRFLFDHLLPFPRRLHMVARLVALGKNSGLSKATRALGLLRVFGRDFAKAESIVEKFPAKALRDRIKPGILKGEGNALRVGYFVGCGVDVIQQSAADSTLQLLKDKAKTVTVLDNCCCGLPPFFYGDLPAAQSLAEKNLNILSSTDFDIIVTDCSSCASFLKKYPSLFEEKDPRHLKAKTLVSTINDFVQWSSFSSVPTTTSKKTKTVTYHDPCHAVRGQGLTKEPRDILKNLQGVEFVEMVEADWCCGGAGSYALSHYDISSRVLDQKMENLKKTKTNWLVTSCPACMIQLSYGIRKHGLNIQVRHISEVVAEHLKPSE